MDVENIIKKNRIASAIYKALGVIIPVISFPYLARVLGTKGIGSIVFAQAFVAVIGIIAQLGIPIYAMRVCEEISDDEEELSKTAHEILMLNLIMCFVSYVILGAFITFVPVIRNLRVIILIFSVSNFLNSIGMDWLYRAMDKYESITLSSVIFKLIAFIVMLIFVHTSSNLIIAAILVAVGNFLYQLVKFIRASRLISFENIGGYDIKQHRGPVFIYAFLTGSSVLLLNLDTIMLGFSKSLDEVGIFGAATWIKTILVGVVSALGAMMIPKASYYIEQGRKADFEIMSSKALNFVVVVATPIAAFFMLSATEIVGCVFGQEYIGAVNVFRIVMPSLLFACLTNIIGMEMLLPMDEEKGALKALIVGVFADIILNVILIPKMGAAGAAIANLSALVIVLIMQSFALRNCITEKKLEFFIVKVIIGTCFGLLGAFLVRLIKLNSILSLILSAIVFFVVYGIMLLYSGEPMMKEIRDSVADMFD